jgi:hypothetical protein
MRETRLDVGGLYTPDIIDANATCLYRDERSRFWKSPGGDVYGFVQCGPPHTIPFPELGRPLGTFFTLPERLIWKPFPDIGSEEREELLPLAREMSKAPWHLLVRRNSGEYECVGQVKSDGVCSGGYGVHLWCNVSNKSSHKLWLETTGGRDWILNLSGWYFVGTTEEAMKYAEAARDPFVLWGRSPEPWQQTITWFSLGARDYAGEAAIWLSTTDGNAASLSMELGGDKWFSTNRVDGQFDADRRCMMGDEYGVACDSIVDVETGIKLFRAFLENRSTNGWHRVGVAKSVMW